jgi:YfiR/HmsC-like
LEKQGKLIAVKSSSYLSLRRFPGCAAMVHVGSRRLFVILLSLWFATSAFSQSKRPEEYQVKAVYLFNFGKFVEWPERAAKGPDFPICVLGVDPFGSTLDSVLAGEVINDRKLVFISSSETSRFKEILAEAQTLPILTVSDAATFLSAGGMIQFVIRDNKVRFDVSLAPADKAGLTLSSQLLKVAAQVSKERKP